jgi:hypothetical protein
MSDLYIDRLALFHIYHKKSHASRSRFAYNNNVLLRLSYLEA